LQQGSGLFTQNSGRHFHLVIQFWAGQQFKTCSKRATLGVVRPVDHARHPRLYNCTSAHRAGLQRHIERRVQQPIVPDLARGLPQYDNLGMRRWVAIADRAIPTARQHFLATHQHGPNRHFPRRRAGPGLLQRHLHEFQIAHKCLAENNTPRVVSLRVVPFNPRILDIRSRRKETVSMKELVERILQLDVLKGMGVTFRTQNPKNIYTEQYPLERPMIAERYRGAPRLNNHPETGETLCIGCNLCALACPENLIVVGWERDDATRRKVLTTFTYDTSRCMFCGLCEDACPTDALELTQDFEMAYYSREGAIWDRHRLEEGPTPTRYTR